MKVEQRIVLVFLFHKYLMMFSFVVVIFLIATVRPITYHHGGDGDGRDPNHPRQVSAQCDETSKLYKYEVVILYFVRNNA